MTWYSPLTDWRPSRTYKQWSSPWPKPCSLIRHTSSPANRSTFIACQHFICHSNLISSHFWATKRQQNRSWGIRIWPDSLFPTLCPRLICRPVSELKGVFVCGFIREVLADFQSVITSASLTDLSGFFCSFGYNQIMYYSSTLLCAVCSPLCSIS